MVSEESNISGGKDSLTLLYALANLQKFYPKHFDLVAITVDLGYEGFHLSGIQKLCEELEVEYHIISTKIGEMVTGDTYEDSACSLCARLRKGAFNDAVQNPCPIDGSTKREYVKAFIRQMNSDNPGVKKRFFHAISEGNLDGWSTK